MLLHIQQRTNWIREQRKRRKLVKKARFRRQLLRYSLLAVLLYLGAAAFKYLPWRINSPQTQVTVAGNQVVTADQVRAALGDITSRPLFRLDPRVLESKIARLEDVQRCFVRRSAIPQPAIRVYVLEEFPWACFANHPGEQPNAVISETGRVIPIVKFPGIICPRLTLYGPPNLQMNSEQVSRWADWAGYIAVQTGKPVDFIDLRRADDVRVQDGDLCLKLGNADSTLTKRLSRLASIVPAINEFRRRVLYVDLALENNIPLKLAGEGAVSSAPHVPLNVVN